MVSGVDRRSTGRIPLVYQARFLVRSPTWSGFSVLLMASMCFSRLRT
jgi:hypothetical protein